MIYPLPNKIIKRFIEKMGLKVFISAELARDDGVVVTLKVMGDNVLEYFTTDYYIINDDGTLDWVTNEMHDNILAEDGIFSYLGDNLSVDGFFVDLASKYAEKYFRIKRKS